MMGYGYENAAGDRISALIDMINGGGPGRSGGTFEGGGILSLLANAVAKPYGSVRERPGHTPMGATAAPRMEVLRPEPVDAAVLPSYDTAVPVDTLRSVVEGAIDRAEAGPELPSISDPRYLGRGAIFQPSISSIPGASRVFKEEDIAFLNSVPESIAPPDLLALFNGIPVGQELTPRESMILSTLRASVERELGAGRP
jgi:hypothetical protein